MKKILTAMSISTLLFIGCGSSGGGGSSSSNPNTNNNNPTDNNDNGNTASELLTKGRVVNGASQGMAFRNRSGTTSASKMYLKLKNSKVESGIFSCGISGTITISKNETSQTDEMQQCIYYDEATKKTVSENGTAIYGEKDNLKISLYQNYLYIPDYENKPQFGFYYNEFGIVFVEENKEEGIYINGDKGIVENLKIVELLEYKDFFYFEKQRNSSFYLQGSFKNTFTCFSETNTFQTDENNWLVPHDTNDDYLKSGTITINDLKYVYKGENVTLSQNGKTEIFVQSEVLESFAETSGKRDCSNQHEIKFSSKAPSKLLSSFSNRFISKGFKRTIFQ